MADTPENKLQKVARVRKERGVSLKIAKYIVESDHPVSDAEVDELRRKEEEAHRRYVESGAYEEDLRREAEFRAEWDRHHYIGCDCNDHVDERKAAVRAYFASKLLGDTDAAPDICVVRDAVRLLEDWATWHSDDEDEFPGDGPLPPDLAAHADDVVPGAERGDHADCRWTWGDAMVMIGINHATYARMAARLPEIQALLDRVTFLASTVKAADDHFPDQLPDDASGEARHGRQVLHEWAERWVAVIELSTGQEPELLDPSLFDLGNEEEEN
jgi:hypothetical protein